MSTDLALITNDPSIIERAGDPGEFVVQCCERGKTWLREALERNDLEEVLETKAQAQAIRVYTVAKGHGEDARLSADEIIRRAERGLGLAVRKGQENGEVRVAGGHEGNQYTSPQDQAGTGSGNTDSNPISPGEYVGYGQGRVDTYAMADDVSDEEFEEVLTQAKAEGNLSRSNVARKARTRSGRASAGSGQPSHNGTGRPPPGRASRRPLPDFARETGWNLRKDTERLQRILADDRFSHHKHQVAADLHGHLEFAIQVCQDVLDRFNATTGA